jgi:hypothetical protein
MANLSFLGHIEAAPGVDYTPIPSGDYVARITDSEMKATSDNRGQYLSLTHEILDGPYKGRFIWARLNLDNPSAQTVEIAQRQIAQICHAIGISTVPQDSMQLHNKPMVIRVEFQPAGPDRKGRMRQKDSNEIKSWKKLDGPAPAVAPAAATGAQHAAPAPAQGAVTQASPAAASTPPWKRTAAA